tara:strand:- start:5199 stop:6698 length:1500 start_codon:yes stop_codon:yes gene_type:complete
MQKIKNKPISLSVLLKGLSKENFNKLDDLSFEGISLNSKEVKENFLFCAVKGKKKNGNDFIKEAFKKGAKFCLTDNKDFEDHNTLYLNNLKDNLGIISSRFFDYPSKKLITFGVTGTNGKTSCVEFISKISNLINLKCGYISTIGISLDGKTLSLPSSLTTPDPITLQRTFYEMVQQGSTQVAFEASSHGLNQSRVNGTDLDVAILTSFSRDHLDYHKNITNYKQAKKKLFTELKPKNIILNTDNLLGKEIFKELQEIKQTSSIFTVSNQVGSDFHYTFSRNKNGYVKVDLQTPETKINFSLKTISKPLAANVVCALAAFYSKGFKVDKVSDLLKDLDFAKGRMEPIFLNKKDRCFIDYAHTTEALEASLSELKNAYGKTNLWCIFGCGGNRDSEKRPKMGSVAEKLTDFLVLTNDNPRTENEMDIISDIKSGLKNKSITKVIPNRREAIFYCLKKIKESNQSNVLLIAGKGHEEYQEISEKKFHFSDHQIVKEFLVSN